MARLLRIASQLGHDPLGTVDATLGETPFHLTKLGLERYSLVELTILVKLEDRYTSLFDC